MKNKIDLNMLFQDLLIRIKNTLSVSNIYYPKRDNINFYFISIFILTYLILSFIDTGISYFEFICLSGGPLYVTGPKLGEGNKLHNEYVVGFCDAEATFSISVTKDNRIRKSSRRSSDNSRIIYSVHPSFAISLSIKDWHLIYSLQSFFGVGKIKQDLSNNAITFYVNSVEDLLNVVIPFFKAHSLLSQKWADFVLFEKAVYLIKEGAHLTTSGLTEIVSIKASMNKGLSDKLVAQFPEISLVERPVLINKGIRDGNWLAGFADGEGSFYIRIKEASSAKSINRVSFFFSISQSIRDSDLIHDISKFLDCGAISSNQKYLQLRVTKFEDVETKIIPFFKNYPMHGIKNLNYLDFCKIMELVQSKVNITTEGINEIKTIKEGMNFGRT